MYAKIENNTVVEWPILNITKLFPNTSFPVVITDSDLPDGYVRVYGSPMPTAQRHQKVVEVTPVRERKRNSDGTFVADDPATPTNEAWQWVQGWAVVDLTPEELAERLEQEAAQVSQNRANAYREEADPLFFKVQRGEATQEEWLEKVQEIKDRYPY